MSNEIQNPNRVLNKEGLSYLWTKIKSALSGKVDKVTGKGLSTNDYDNTEKANLASAYTHAVTNKGIQANLGLYKIETNSEGHVTQISDIEKIDADITEADNDISEPVGTGVMFSDTNGQIGGLGVLMYPDGDVQSSWGVQNYNISEGEYTGMGGMEVTVDKTGNISWAVTGENSFRGAINAKGLQTAVSDPSASGDSITFIDTISQNTNGEIAVTKKTVRSASTSQSGVVTTGTQSFAGTKTFTANTFVEKTSGDIGFYAKNTTSNLSVGLQVGSSGTNHGVQSSGYVDSNGIYHASNIWIVYRNNTGNVILNGKADSADSVEWSNVANKVNASTSSAGIVSTGEQSFAGQKIFTSNPLAKKASGETGWYINRSDKGLSLNLIINSTGVNQGIYSTGYVDGDGTYHADAKYLICRNSNNSIYINGRADSASSVPWSGVTDKVNASASAAGIVSTGAQTFAGAKTFNDGWVTRSIAVIKNSATNPYISFQGLDIGTTNALIYAMTAETSAGKYGTPQFYFYEYSPSSDGASRTSYYDRYRLPAVASGKTANHTYDILTTKDAYQIKTYSMSITVTASSTLSVTASQLGVSTPSGYSPVGFTGIATGNNNIYVYYQNATITGSNNIIQLRNIASTDKTCTLTVHILYLKSITT
ncbi:MAG: hypothetical protein J6Y78_16125 [Paludibacteraceae bacterium]|nr:hypothetical protein [Paludibacteraceae bacterium]